jgi:hypothetical protein
LHSIKECLQLSSWPQIVHASVWAMLLL